MEFKDALNRLLSAPPAMLEAVCFDTLDACNHRVDAWITSLASSRLSSLRALEPRGMVIGGWGWLQDVRPTSPAFTQQRAEYIHAPSLDQAAAAAVMRSAALDSTADSRSAQIDLSSKRVRTARWVLEGLRNGRSIGELLGAHAARRIASGTTAEQLGVLHEALPGIFSGKTPDGLHLLQSRRPPLARTSLSDAALRAVTAAAEDSMDAVADSLTAEAVYQLVKGNPGGALASLQSIAQGDIPPELTFVETPVSATHLTHRVATVIPTSVQAPGWLVASTPRTRADPMLDTWCGLLLGPASDFTVFVDSPSGVSLSFALSELAIGALDVVMAGRDNGLELTARCLLQAQRKMPSLKEPFIRPDRAWRDLIGLATAMSRLIARAEPLQQEVFDPPGLLQSSQPSSSGDLETRSREVHQTLTALKEALPQQTSVRDALLSAALVGIRIAGWSPLDEPSTGLLESLRIAIDERLASVGESLSPREELRALLGGEVLGLIPLAARDASALATLYPPTAAELLEGKDYAPAAWLDMVSRVRDGAARLNDVLQRLEAAGRDAPMAVAQLPWQAGDRWIATSFKSTSEGASVQGRLSVVLYAPGGVQPEAAMGGMLIDSWTEAVPTGDLSTGMALRFNSPNTRPPQAILLAVSPDPTRPWSQDTLVSILGTTLDNSRMRMQSPTAWSRAGHMPLTQFGTSARDAGEPFAL